MVFNNAYRTSIKLQIMTLGQKAVTVPSLLFFIYENPSANVVKIVVQGKVILPKGPLVYKRKVTFPKRLLVFILTLTYWPSLLFEAAAMKFGPCSLPQDILADILRERSRDSLTLLFIFSYTNLISDVFFLKTIL